jgi:hypothetical protein
MYSLLSVLTGAVLVGLVYGLSFLPTATLIRADDEIGVGLDEDEAAVETGDTDSEPGARA